MKSVEERLNGKENNQKQVERIIENEKLLIRKAREQCTEETEVKEASSHLGTDKEAKHYILEGGTHVFDQELGGIIITNNADERCCEWYKGKNLPENGVYIINRMGGISYFAKNNGEVIFGGDIYKQGEYSLVLYNNFGNNKQGRQEKDITKDGIVKGDTLLDVIEDNISVDQKENDKVIDVLLNDFHAMLNPLGRDDLTFETEEEIIARKALEEKKKVDTENRELKAENTKLKKENLDLKARLMKVRTFITERCAKIPFFGKRLLREMQSELGENQLQEAKENENENIDR